MSRERKVPRRRFREFQNGEAWKQIKIGEAGSFYYGHSCPKWSVTEDATIPCIRYGELYTKFGTKIDRVFSYTNISPNKLRFSKGTEVLIPRVGEDPMDYNHCTWLSMPGVAIGEMISVYNTEQNPLFTATMFNATLQEEFAVRVEGGSVTNLYFEKLKNIDVCFPSIAEQEKIAGFIEKIDNIINLNQHKLKKLKALKKAYLTQMFPSVGESKPKLRFAGFDDEWEQRKLDTITDVRDGTHDSPNYYENGYPFITSKNVKDGHISYDDIQYISYEDYEEINKRSKVEKNDILMGMIGTIGNLALVRSEPNFAIKNVALIKDIQQINYLYLYHYLYSSNIEQLLLNGMDGGTQKFFALNKIRELNIVFPLNEEQSKIGDYFECIDKLINLNRRKLQKLQNLKKAYLNEMFI